MPTKLTIIELDMDKLEEILRRVEAQDLHADDYEAIRTVIQSYVGLFSLLGDKNTTIQRLRKMLFGASTEKTAAVIGGGKDAGLPPSRAGSDSTATSQGAEEAASATGTEREIAAEPPKKGHGRNGADAYVGARRSSCPTNRFSPAILARSARKGTVYETGRPGVLVRLVGQSPIRARVYELQKLRCNLCGVVFTAQSPEGVGAKKYDATAGSMIALLKYGSGMPFNRLEGLQQNVRVPLPASTQWEIVHAKAEQIEPVFEELIRQAAQGEVVFNDDTTVKILELMDGRDKEQALAEDAANDDDASEKKSDRRGMFTSGVVSSREGRRIAPVSQRS